MRFTNTFLLALPALVLAEQAQVPLVDKVKGWFGAASSYVSSAASAAPAAASKPVQAATKQVINAKVANLTLNGYKDVLLPASGKSADEWIVFITGGNVTCFGMCANATKAWNESVPILAALPTGPKLALLDCEAEPVLCNMWATGPPTVYHFLIPSVIEEATVRHIRLNRTSVTSSDIVAIHTKQKYQVVDAYTGPFHPFNGLISAGPAGVAFGYASWAFAKMPSWLPMILVSVLSRTFMGRRMNPGGPAAPGGAAPGAAAPAAAR